MKQKIASCSILDYILKIASKETRGIMCENSVLTLSECLGLLRMA